VAADGATAHEAARRGAKAALRAEDGAEKTSAARASLLIPAYFRAAILAGISLFASGAQALSLTPQPLHEPASAEAQAGSVFAASDFWPSALASFFGAALFLPLESLT